MSMLKIFWLRSCLISNLIFLFSFQLSYTLEDKQIRIEISTFNENKIVQSNLHYLMVDIHIYSNFHVRDACTRRAADWFH